MTAKQSLAVSVWLLALGALAGTGGTARATTVALHCVNAANGATWQFPVDLDKGRVASFPARITAGDIVWEDTVETRYYDFDRASGTLTMHVSSSTGGYYREDSCRLK